MFIAFHEIIDMLPFFESAVCNTLKFSPTLVGVGRLSWPPARQNGGEGKPVGAEGTVG